MNPTGLLAHVAYVTPASGATLGVGDLIARLLERPAEVALFLGAGLGLLLIAILDLARTPLREVRRAFNARAESYLGLTPWMLRLSVGLPLLGAGVLRYAFAPDITLDGFPYLVLTGIGFVLLIGLGTRLAAALLIGLGSVVALRVPHVIEVVEMPALAAGILLVGSGVPALDDLLRAVRRRDPARPARPAAPDELPSEPDILPRLGTARDPLALLVRLGVGLSFLSAGLSEKLLDPGRAALAVEKYDLTALLPLSSWAWIAGVGVVESLLGLLIVVGAWTRPVAMLGFAVLTMTLFGLPDDPVLAHVSLFGSLSILVVTGAGRWSLDAILDRIRERRPPPVLRPASGQRASA